MDSNTPSPEPGRVGLYYFAWEMESFERMKKMHGELKDSGVTIAGTGNHGISLGDPCLDPDGNKIEAFYELPQEQWPKKDAGPQAGVARDPSSIHWDE